MDEYYDDPRYAPSQGRWVTYNADAGAVWEPLTVGAPVGQYVTTNGDAGGQYVENTAAQQAAINAQLEANRQAELQAAAAYVAANPLPITGDQIATQYGGNQDISRFLPITTPGQAVTGSTPTQLVDPSTGAPVFLSDPNDPYSFTYNPTGTPAIGGTLEQQAALFKPFTQQGAFGTLGGDLLEGIKDPYFRNFAIAAAAMAAAAALAPAAAGSVGGSTAGGAGATAFPIDFGSTILTGGELAGGGSLGAAGGSLGGTGSTAGGFLGGSGDILAGAVGTGGGSLGGTGIVGSTAGGFLGGSGDILAGAAGTGGGSLGASGFGLGQIGSTIGNAITAGGEALAGPYGSLIKGGLTLGGLAAANALKPKTDESTGSSGFTSEQLQALVAGMPSMIDQYTAMSNSTGQPLGGYNPNMGSSLANLFPNFTLPTQGLYGAGRFGNNYVPAPLTTLV